MNLLRMLLKIIVIIYSVIVVSVIIVINIELVNCYEIFFTIDGFRTLIDQYMYYKTVFSGYLLLISIIIAITTLENTLKESKKQTVYKKNEFMLNLRSQFLVHEEIHIKLRGDSGVWAKKIPQEDDNNENWAKIDSYMGLFENCYFILKDNQLDKNEFFDLYGYRVHNISLNESIMERIELEKESWRNLLALIKEYSEFKSK